MDPLSIVTSTVALVEAAVSISRAISRLRQFGDIPQNLNVLKSEINDLAGILEQVHDAVQQDSTSMNGTYASLGPVLTRTTVRLRDLTNALARVEQEITRHKVKSMIRLSIWNREKDTFDGFQNEIVTIKISLLLLLCSTTNRNMQGNLMELQRHLTCRFDRRDEVLFRHLDALERRIMSKASPKEANLLRIGATPLLESETDVQIDTLVQQARFTRRKWCPCTCHTRRKSILSTPKVVQGVLGKISINHSGMAPLKNRCDFGACRHQSNASAIIEYKLPSWIVSANLTISFTYLPRNGPELLLSTTCRVADDSQSITFAMEGNTDGLKQLFDKQLAGPRDVSDSRGYTLIRWALYGGMHNYNTVKFLLSQGATVDEISYENVWDFIMRGKCTEAEQAQLRCITDGRGTDWIEEQNFPLIHKIIFGLSSKSLEAELEENPRAIDLKDSQNRTALDWATARAQLGHMAILLRYKANPNNMDTTGRTPVLHAVDSHSIEGLRLILQYKGNPNPTYSETTFRSSPLTAAGFAGKPALLKLLLQYNADPNACNPEGLTALYSVARTHNIECASLLLEYGADLNAMSKQGRTPLTTAIIHNNHPVLRLFMDKCGEYLTVPRFHVPQILRAIAEHADTTTIKILATMRPSELVYDFDPESLDTTQMLLEQRDDYNPELQRCFGDLMVSASYSIEEVNSPASMLESGFFFSARSSFHSEISTAILRLNSLTEGNIGPAKFNFEAWQDTDEVFYSPISPGGKESFVSPMSPFASDSFFIPTYSAPDNCMSNEAKVVL